MTNEKIAKQAGIRIQVDAAVSTLLDEEAFEDERSGLGGVINVIAEMRQAVTGNEWYVGHITVADWAAELTKYVNMVRDERSR